MMDNEYTEYKYNIDIFQEFRYTVTTTVRDSLSVASILSHLSLVYVIVL